LKKIFHAAEYDLICLKRDFDFDVVNLFDTMFAARILRYENFGLAHLLHEHFDVDVDKSHQLDDWAIRPLPQDSLAYAQMDTHYLPRLRDILLQKMVYQGRLDEALEIFADVTRIDVKSHEFDPEGYWKIGKPRSLKRRQIAVLRELYLLRDEIARAEDVPPYKIMSNKTLIRLATEQPRNYQELENIRGLHGRTIRLYGHEIADAIEVGLTSSVPTPPKSERPDPKIAERYMQLHAWRKERAIERGVDSNIVISKHSLWEIARTVPRSVDDLRRIEGIGTWRQRTYGDEILQVVSSFKR
jgi:ribonuclease D